MIQRTPLAAAILVSLASASSATAEPACYDAKIRARPIDQIPSEIGDCDGGCIIMSWPWFVDLQVERVIDGTHPGKIVRALSIQHTYRMPREATWLLRKNTAGGYNILTPESVSSIARCPAEAALVEPYIRPGEKRTLDNLRDAGIHRYGHHTS